VEYTTTLGAVIDLKSERRWNSQSLVWSVRSGWRRAVSFAWNATLIRWLRGNPCSAFLFTRPIFRTLPSGDRFDA